jgi:hypothetical protein
VGQGVNLRIMEAQPGTTASEGKDSSNWRIFILWPLVILLVYVSSIGPVVMMMQKGFIRNDNRFVSFFYAPIEWVSKIEPVGKAFRMYLHLWDPKDFDKNGDWNWQK